MMWSFRSSLSSSLVVANNSAVVRLTQSSLLPLYLNGSRDCRCFHRRAKHLSPHSTSKGGNDFVSNSTGGDNGAGPTTATVPIQTYNKSPIVAELWRSRDEAKKRVAENVCRNNGKPTGKHPKESQVGIPYLFSKDTYLLETYRNPWGEMRFGKILEDLDALAGNIAFHHVAGGVGGIEGLLPLIVTASVDRIRVRSRPDISTSDQYLSGKVTFVGSSSLEIRMKISSILSSSSSSDDNTNNANNEQEGDEWLEAYFTFVTLHPITKKAISIPSLLPETEEEYIHYELGARKAQIRKEQRQQNNTIVEQQRLFIDTRAKELLLEAGPLLQMPSLADPNTILISSTLQSNALIAQPQSRNLHDRIFGGFLMRRAFELAFATAYLFGGDRPQFIEVDDVSFDKPVDVGNLLVFKSLVLHTWPNGGGNNIGCAYDDDDVDDSIPLVVVEVECWITVPETTKAEKSNNFYFTFALPNKTSCRRVLPANIDQARRQAARMYEYEKNQTKDQDRR